MQVSHAALRAPLHAEGTFGIRTSSVVPLHYVTEFTFLKTLYFSFFWYKQIGNESSFYDAITTEKHWSTYRLWEWVFVLHTNWLLRDSVITMLIEKAFLRIGFFVTVQVLTITKGIEVDGTASISSASFELLLLPTLLTLKKAFAV